MQELPHTHGCFVCGESNPLGLRLRFHTDGRVVRTEFVPQTEHFGFRDVVHGGLVSTVLDEIMVWACAVPTRRFGYCAEMTVRFQQPLRPGKKAIATGELVTNRRNRLFEARSELTDESGALLASATGKYIPIKDADLAALAGDLIGDRTLF